MNLVRFLVSLLFLISGTVFAECTITWTPNDSAENVIEYRVYHTSDGGAFVFKGPAIVTGTTTTCSGQSIDHQTGHIGLTAVNNVGESEMSTAAFPPGDLPNRPTTILITIPRN